MAKTTTKNPFITIEGNVGTYKMSSGKSFTFDAEDAKTIGRYRWYTELDANGKTVVRSYIPGTTRRTCPTAVLGYARMYTVNDGSLDFRKSAIENRYTSKSNILYTSKLSSGNKTGMTGVQNIPGGKYKAQITSHGTVHYLGTFATKAEAAVARMKAEKIFCKDFVNNDRKLLRKALLEEKDPLGYIKEQVKVK